MTKPPHPDMPVPGDVLPQQPGEALTGVDMSTEAEFERRGDQRAQISNAMVALKKRFYGKGPERARSFLVDEYVFCAMEGGLTRNEEVLVEAGQERAVREYRLLFQEAMTKTVCEAVEQITGRTVIGYHSQITFRPTRTFEIFVLE
ncbi:MAG TPA: Na-translocating system protein MpsC family protein [Solirubrobacteraceae bacterium]|nr:Na-translocating system protein MpsC family protein [Solirubrobacteraceae bacterium]